MVSQRCKCVFCNPENWMVPQPKLKFKINHIKTMNFNTAKIRKEFEKVRLINKEIIDSAKVDPNRLDIRFDI